DNVEKDNASADANEVFEGDFVENLQMDNRVLEDYEFNHPENVEKDNASAYSNEVRDKFRSEVDHIML
ncbi:hypothetical protein L195_g023197, partial [Trifolium pratense]